MLNDLRLADRARLVVGQLADARCVVVRGDEDRLGRRGNGVGKASRDLHVCEAGEDGWIHEGAVFKELVGKIDERDTAFVG